MDSTMVYAMVIVGVSLVSLLDSMIGLGVLVAVLIRKNRADEAKEERERAEREKAEREKAEQAKAEQVKAEPVKAEPAEAEQAAASDE